MKKPTKGTKRLMPKSKSPGATPKSTHLQPMERKRKSVPESSHPVSNLKGFAYKKGAKLPRGGLARAVANEIKSSKGRMY